MNALRYIPVELHEKLAPEFMEELLTRGRIYGYRYRPQGDLKAKPISEYKGKCIEGKAFQVMIDNNLCFDIALYPYELVTYGETGQVCQNWMQYRLIKKRLGRIIVAYTFDGKPVTADDLQATGSMAALLKDALKPNLIQTLEHTPAIVHGGPFANIAHGCNSVRATKTALKLADYVITEAGFGADLGAEKFFDIKCRMAGLKPDAVVLVATIRALKYNGGVPKDELSSENLDALKAGIVNLEKHIENLHKFGVPVVVTLNSFVTDTKAETDFVEQFCKERGCEFALSEVWEKGGEGGIDLANKVLETIEHKESNFKVLYDDSLSLKEKIETVAKEIYGADGVTYSPAAERELKRITDLGMGDFPVCMAKTQYSLSDDAKKLGRPSGFKINVREVYASAGAGFVVAVNGSIMTMPGLSKKPAAYGIDVDDNGVITGLF